MYTQENSPFSRVRKTTKGKGRNFRSTKEGAGMTSAGVKKYRKENPGRITGSIQADISHEN